MKPTENTLRENQERLLKQKESLEKAIAKNKLELEAISNMRLLKKSFDNLLNFKQTDNFNQTDTK